jgi:hypothetical protein
VGRVEPEPGGGPTGCPARAERTNCTARNLVSRSRRLITIAHSSSRPGICGCGRPSPTWPLVRSPGLSGHSGLRPSASPLWPTSRATGKSSMRTLGTRSGLTGKGRRQRELHGLRDRWRQKFRARDFPQSPGPGPHLEDTLGRSAVGTRLNCPVDNTDCQCYK